MLRHFFKTYALATAGAYALAAFTAAPAQQLDPTFQPPTQFTPQFTENGYYSNRVHQVETLARDGAGNLLVGGWFDQVGGTVTGRVTRLLPSGAPDPTFNPTGTGANGTVRQLVVLPGGKLLIAGSFTRYNGAAVGRLARLNADGSLDASFNPGGSGADQPIESLVADAAGRIYAGGLFTTFNGQPAYGLVRLTPTGAVDPAFVTGTGFQFNLSGVVFPSSGGPNRLALDSQGRLIVGGAGYYQQNPQSNLIRLLPTGALDPTFNPGGASLNGAFSDLQILPDDGMLIAGGLYSYNGVILPGQSIIRVTSTGILDPTFTVAAPPMQVALAVAALPGGQVLVGGYRSVVRLTATGALDPTFIAPTVDVAGGVRVLLPRADGSIDIGGSFERINQLVAGGFARLTATGAPDPAVIRTRLGTRQLVTALLKLPGDSLLVAGGFDPAAPTTTGSLMRLTPDGRPDASFRIDPSLFVGPVAVAPSGKVFVSDYGRVYRLTATGAIDAGFNDGSGLPNWRDYIQVVKPLADGNVLVGGSFRAYSGVPCDGLVRLTPTGAVDPTFRPARAPGRVVDEIAVRADDHIALLTYSDSTGAERGLIGLRPDGSPDLAFGGGNPTSSYAYHARLVALPDTSLLMIGQTDLGGNANQARPFSHLTRTGVLDPRFRVDPSLLANDPGAAAVQPDGSILFTTRFPYRPFLRRLQPDGSLDAGFQSIEIGTGAEGESLESMVTQRNGALVLGGRFTSVGATPSAGLARLTGIPPLGVALLEPAPARGLTVYPNPAHDYLTVRLPNPTSALELLDLTGRRMRSWPTTNTTDHEQTVRLTGLPAGVFVLRTQETGGTSRATRVVVD